MAFQNESGGFGNKGSKKIEKNISSSTTESIKKIKEKGQEIAKKNENTINTAKKTAVGCYIALVISGVIISAIIIYILYKIFS